MSMKTSEEYLAEYVREKRPEIEGSLDYFFWKLGRQLGDVVHGVIDTLNSMTVDERMELLNITEGEVEENDDD